MPSDLARLLNPPQRRRTDTACTAILWYHSLADKRLWFGDWCEYIRYSTVRLLLWRETYLERARAAARVHRCDICTQPLSPALVRRKVTAHFACIVGATLGQPH